MYSNEAPAASCCICMDCKSHRVEPPHGSTVYPTGQYHRCAMCDAKYRVRVDLASLVAMEAAK